MTKNWFIIILTSLVFSLILNLVYMFNTMQDLEIENTYLKKIEKIEKIESQTVQVGGIYIFSYQKINKNPFRTMPTDTVKVMNIKEGYVLFKDLDSYERSMPISEFLELSVEYPYDLSNPRRWYMNETPNFSRWFK